MSATNPKKEASLAVDANAKGPSHGTFGDLAPWSEPAWYNSLESPYYGESHRRLRKYIRDWMDTNIMPHHLEWEAAGEAPRSVAKLWSASGLAHGDVPRAYRPPELRQIAGIDVDSMDAFHFLIMSDETSRAEGGVMAGLTAASAIGAPPIINHGTEEQKLKWLPGLFTTKTAFCLGITEPSGGSDVSNIRTTAKKTPDGNHYIVNGHKKWITGTPWASHCTTAVRTGPKGFAGISLLVIPLDAEGVSTKRIANSGQSAGGASWINFENVKVPAGNLLGKENHGFRMIMTNFNKERFMMAIGCNRKSRTCLSVALNYAHERETFGQPLVSHQIIRAKLTTLGRKVESHWAWLEQIAYHVDKRGWQAPDIAGRIALAKVEGGQILELAAREAQQVLGGVGYQKGGVGGQVEQITRDLRMMVVGGGSEEILGDLAYREEIKRARQLGALL